MNYFLIPPVEEIVDTSVLYSGQCSPDFQIYVSIPFCLNKCKSCPFFKTMTKIDNLDEEIIKYIAQIISKDISDWLL